MEKKDITIYDIAKEAKVSPATVSRVLTGNAPVRDETRKRIEDIIKKYNFQPNALARSLFKKESKMIGVILPDITNPFFSTVFLEAEKYALEKGYTMILCDSINDGEIESIHLKTLCEKQVDAIIFMGGRVNHASTNKTYAKEFKNIIEKIPILIVNGKMTGTDCYKVITDEGKAISQLVDYLIGLGHTKIAMLGGTSTTTSTLIKHKAFFKAMENNNLKVNKEWIIFEGYAIESGINGMKKLLSSGNIPTAVMTINDFVAIGAIQVAKLEGYNIPRDISITGFDGTFISEIVSPQLTTVDQNYVNIGKAVVDNIVDILSKKSVDKEKIIETRLIIRDSCSKNPKYI